MNRYPYTNLWAVVVMLLLFTTMGGAQTPASFAAPVATSMAGHPWWSMSQATATAYYEEGRHSRREGKTADALRLGLYPAADRAVVTLDHPGTFLGVALVVPALQLRRDGFEAENRMASEDECRQEVQTYLQRRPSVDFVGVIRPLQGEQGEGTLTLTPLLVIETSTGQKLRLDEPSTPTEMMAQLAAGEPAFTMAHRESDDTHLLLVSLPLYDKQGKAFLTPDTAWVRLWVFGESKRIPITYNLQGKLPAVGEDSAARVIIGKAE